jgi:Tol biopolymer transport system component
VLLTCGLVWVTASHAAASKREGTIAFIRMANERVFGGRLFVVRPDGSGLRQLTPQRTKVWSYAWSPDGSLIAYIDQRSSLWLVRPDGTGRRLLLPSSRLSSTSLSWSPDGKEIAVASPGANVKLASCVTTLYVVPVGGGQPVSLQTAAGCDVAWSPRGDQIADDGTGIGVMRADGSGRRHFLHVGGGPEWSADGTQLAFDVAIHLRNGSTDRYRAFGVVDADGNGFHVVTTHAYNEYGVAWSPDGGQILYGRADRMGIYVIGADGRNNHRVTRDSPPQADWGALAWSPDGGSVIYDTGTYNNTDLYVIGADGRGKVQLTSTPDIDIDPTWVAR